MAGGPFGGGMFGKPLRAAGPAPVGGPRTGPVPMGQGSGPGALPQGFTPPAMTPQAAPTPSVPSPAPKTAMGPQGPVPLGAKKDCPVCRG